MLGFADITIAAVYILCILSGLLCVVYGIVNWNKGGTKDASPSQGIPPEEPK